MFRSILAGALLGAQTLWALTGGPSQPEYTGFTPSTKSGSVDLYSGDFSYSIPLMTVPGPAFNYPIVLGYRAGITTDQASSWVGLGWSLNAGSINRALNRYPDDYLKGKAINILEGESKVYAWDLGVSYMGIGLSVGQRSDHGWHGGLDFSLAGYDIGGVKFDQADGFGMREMTTLTDQFIGKAVGAGQSALNGSLNDLLGTQQIGLSVNPSAHGLNVSVAGVGFGSSSVSSGAFNNSTFGVSIPVLNTGVTIDFSSSTSWLYRKEVDDLYGYLHLQEFPREIDDNTFQTKSHRMEYNWAPDNPLVQKNGNSFESWLLDMFFKQKAFVTSTPDGYQAKAEGVSMSFRPYRQEIGDYYGSERLEAEVGFWIALINKTWLSYIPYFGRQEEEDKDEYNRQLGEYATQFVRQEQVEVPNEQAANYSLKYQTATHKYPVALFRETGTSGGTFLGENWRPRKAEAAPRCGSWGCDLNYRRRNNGTAQAGYANPNIQSSPDGSMYPDRISGGNGVFPIYKNGYDASGIDTLFCDAVDEAVPQCDPAVPYKALVGFTVVRPDGMVYEYHKPVFNWLQKTLSVVRPDEKAKEGAYDFGAIGNSSTMNRAYATSWLLTAIKAPDYVDLGTPGPGDEDIGSWVGFNYGKRIKTFHWRTPYEGMNPTGVGKQQPITDGVNTSQTITFEGYGQASWGSKEIYYLTSIATPSHIANFISSPKLENDGLESANKDEAVFQGSTYTVIDSWTLTPETFPDPAQNDVLQIAYRAGSRPSETEFCNVPDDTPTSTVEIGVASVTGSTAADFQKMNGRRGFSRITLKSAVPSECPELVSVHRIPRTGGDHVLQKLDRIELREKVTNELLNSVRLAYESDNAKELAPGIPDVPVPATSGPKEGKLTLRGVYVGDGQMELPPYRFTYYLEGDKAPYDRLAWDRWGFYKSNGGWINTELIKGHVVDWNYFLTLLKSTTTSFAKTTFENAVLQELDAADFNALKAAADPAAIREGYYRAMVKALNRIRTNLTFYSSNRAQFSSVPGGANWSDDWLKMAKDSACLNSDGSQVPDPELLLPNQKNILHGLHAALLVESLFRPTTTTNAILRDVSITTFDHETNPEDVKAWSLKQVALPSGGRIDVEYESDNFVYVGRSRVMDLADVDQYKATGNLEYFRNIGQEKSLTSPSSLLRFDEALLGEAYYKNPSQVKLRVSSLFRVYKKDADGNWGTTPMFEKMRTKPGLKLTLLGWHNSLKVNDNIFSGDLCGYVKFKNSAGDMSSKGFQAPFVLGTVAEDIEIKTGQTDEWYAANQCQRAYVDFDLTAISLANLEAANKLINKCDQVGTEDFLKKLQYLTLSWGRPRDPSDPTDWPLFVPLTQGPDFDDKFSTYTEFIDLDPRPSLPANPASTRHYYAQEGDLAPPLLPLLLTSDFTQRPDEYRESITFQPQPGGPWLGPGRWDVLQEFSTTDVSDSWDVMSYSIGRRMPGGDPVSLAAGLPGGGIRVKRLSYNSGWPQRPGDPPQTQVTEYAYDCSGADGGVYSSGSTPAMPPPYNNKGDDRPPLPPEIGLVEGAPFVGYRRVTEIRPGRGRIVHDFLSPADIGDFISYENCNGGNIENGLFLGYQAGCYDMDSYMGWVMTPHARWKLNRVSQFQGLPTAKTKYSQRKSGGGFDLVAEEKFTYLTSLKPEDVGNIITTALLNNSDAVNLGALESYLHKPTEDSPLENRLHAGSRDYAFTEHPASEHMGKTIERMRLRWYYKENKSTARSNIGLNEMEVVEHSLRQWQVTSKVDGVGTRTAHSYYDFLTGEPLVTVVSGLKEDIDGKEVVDNALPTKTTVTTPAHWVREYNPTTTPTADLPSMGPIYNDPHFFEFSTGKFIPGSQESPILSKNMLTQTFSQSTYSDLSEYSLGFPWKDGLEGTQILNRSITTWKLLSGNRSGIPIPAWRIDETYSLRLPMSDSRHVLVDRGTVAPPLPASGGSVQSTYRDNPAYVLGSQNTLYGELGEVLETRDAYDGRVASFYRGNKYLVGQVVNSDRASCALLTVDEMSSLASLNPVWNVTGGAIVSTAARSGSKSLYLNTTGQMLTMTLPEVRHNRVYEFSLWAKDPGNRGFITLRVDGTQAAILPVTYNSSGPEWQRTLIRLPLVQSSPATKQVTAEVLLEDGPGNGMWIDDVRFLAEDAQAYTMTYDIRGNRSTEAGPNDILSRYKYDAFDKLVEIQDHQGVVVSTQAEMEAK